MVWVLGTIECAYPKNSDFFCFDNFFTSIRLLENINSRRHGATDTLRSGIIEKCPFKGVQLFEKHARGSEEHFFLDKESNAMVVRWNDNGIVTMGSNQFGVFPITKAERYSAAEREKC